MQQGEIKDSKNKKVAIFLLPLFFAIFLFTGYTFLIKKSVTGIFFGKRAAVIRVDAAAQKENREEAKVLFLGDMMFDRYIRQTANQKGYGFIFQKVDPLLKDSDLVVGNLEGPITDNSSVSVDSKMGERDNYVFTFDQNVGAALAGENIRLVNIGNNHISNFGSAGLESTRGYLTKAGVGFFGDPEKDENRMSIKGYKRY